MKKTLRLIQYKGKVQNIAYVELQIKKEIGQDYSFLSVTFAPDENRAYYETEGEQKGRYVPIWNDESNLEG